MASQDNLAPKKSVVPLSARRNMTRVPLEMTGAVGQAASVGSRRSRLSSSSFEPLDGRRFGSVPGVKTASLDGKRFGSVSSVETTLLDGKRFGSVSSVETTWSLDWDFEESRVSAQPICQMGYDVHEVLGSGSMAVAYRVVRRCDGQELAAKCVKSTDEECRSLTVGEHSLMRQLAHENILEAKELFEFPTEIWLCTELCAEGSVHSHVRQRGAFDDGRCRALARQLVAGGQYLHSKRIVHRDLKPKNLLLSDGASRLKIADFNCARRVGTTEAQPKAVCMLSMCGTPLYLAPELRFNLAWNERVDIWGIGLSVYFMARAAAPFNVGNPKVIEALQEGKLPHVSWQGMSTAMAHLVQQCLIVDMRSRPTAMELQWHPAFEAVPGDRGSGSAETPKLQQGGSDPTVRSACGLLFSCTAFQALPSGVKEDWRRAALRTLAMQHIPTLEKLLSLGAACPWAV